MKHIKKKFYLESKDVPVPLKEGKKLLTVDRSDNATLKNIKKGENISFVKTEDENYRLALIYKHQGQHIFLPVPDFTLVYFNNAYLNNKSRKKLEKLLFKKINNIENGYSENVDSEIYGYIGIATSAIIQMFTSLESFINYLIPDEGVYIKIRPEKTESYNKEQIQKNIRFMEKVKEVLPFFTSKNFFINQTLTNNHIVNLKNIRDEIVHTKSNFLYQSQTELLEKLLKFKYDDTLSAIRKFMNFYIKDYNIDCDCSSEE
ncbi:MULTISPECIES: hypothetical protein [Empedobacter]|uniref:RiboL-PSP-HEPN domain-containing protein n=1 Tax=Empedobacter falsenii TaxID=343874 RepID=A0AAW7DGD5_9FLAO|nr:MULTISPECIES: hypothetical protein [Empedobacter]MDM1550521.1 hypothetical protein [Empedobacter falsenii]